MKKTVTDAIELHKNILAEYESTCIDTTVAIAQMIIDSLNAGGCVYICGNGGSAADAQHIACELVGRFLKERKALPAVAMTTDTSILTAVGNDYDFDHVFTRQVEALVKENDILWALSTSGKSPGILAAAKQAKSQNAKVIAFTGKASSPLEDIADITLKVEAPNSYSAQQIHQIAYHVICDLVEQNAGK